MIATATPAPMRAQGIFFFVPEQTQFSLHDVHPPGH